AAVPPGTVLPPWSARAAERSLPPQGSRPRTPSFSFESFSWTSPVPLYGGEPTIPPVHFCHDDIDCQARFSYSYFQEVPVFDDLRALVEFARAGSVVGAADRLYRTPSAITRQLQRLEAAVGATLLDRSVKPPRLNSLGSRVLEQARDLLQRTEALKSVTSTDAEPHGLLRIGLSHPLAEGTLIGPILALTETYARVRLRLLSEL